MPGPRAPLGSLWDHMKNAANLMGGPSGLRDSRNNKHLANESEDDEESSNSDSDISAGEDDGANPAAFLAKITSKSAASQKSNLDSPTTSPIKTEPLTSNSAKVVVEKKTASSKATSTTSEDASKSDVSSEEGSDGESTAESSSEKNKQNMPRNIKMEEEPERTFEAATNSSSSSSSESESEEDSSSGESEEEETPKVSSNHARPQPSAQTDLKTAPAVDGSKGPTPAKKTNSSKFQAGEDISGKSSSEADSETDESGESESESESESDDDASGTLVLDKRSDGGVATLPPQVVAADFHLRKAVDSHAASEIAQFLDDAQKQGKQIWYFTAPESVPIDVIQEHAIPLDRAQAGLPILTHNGDDYGVDIEASISHTIKLVIPSKDGANYELFQKPVEKTIHMKRMTRFSNGDETAVAVSEARSAIVPPRPQPKGLKARYLPIGVNAPRPTNEDTRMTSTPTSAGATAASSNSRVDKKRKHSATVAEGAKVPQTPTDSGKTVKKARSALDTSDASVRVTPVPPPSFPAYSQSPAVSRSSPAAKTVKVASSPMPSNGGKSKSEVTPRTSTQPVPSKKVSQVPLPPYISEAASKLSPSPDSSASTPVAKPKKKKKKDKRSAIPAPSESDIPERKTVNNVKAPIKETPIPLPNFGNSA